MEAAWFAIIAGMLAVYVVLDGFDFGAGIVHFLVARREAERRAVFSAIGPLWDGNEVWLIAGGGVLVYAFPRAYASAFSGFYLPLMMVLWLLILRGLSIELRGHEASPLWRDFWDATFAFASTALALLLGVALGNLVRGVPLDESGYFRAPLFTNFRPGLEPGALDWYTILAGLFAVLVLAGHGANYLGWKVAGEMAERCRRVAARAWIAAAVMLVPLTRGTWAVRPAHLHTFTARAAGWPFALVALAGLGAIAFGLVRRRPLTAFLGSSVFLAGALAATAVALYPVILPSTHGAAFDLTAHNAAAGRRGLRLGLLWWIPAVAIAIGYFVFLFRSFRGKITPAE